jgi:H+-transporting ATPase
MGTALLAFCTSILATGRFELHLGMTALQSLTFVTLVFGSQAMLYAIRQRRRMWGARPSVWLIASSVTDVLIASVLAIGGIAMTALPAVTVMGVLGAAVVFAVVMNVVKIPVFARLGIT